MSALLDGVRLKGKAKVAPALAVGLPQVNLLPPEVNAARGLRKTKRVLLVAVAATVAGCVAVYGLAVSDAGKADDEYTAAQQRTSDLQAKQAKYREVPLVQGQLANATKALRLGMSTDIEWARYLGAITASLPKNISIDSFVVTAPTPMSPITLPADPLGGISFGSIQFTAKVDTLPDAAAWMDALDGVPGFSDSWVSTAQIGEDDTSDIHYAVAATVQLDIEAFSHRFDAVDGGK
jgi:hypothetical protein